MSTNGLAPTSSVSTIDWQALTLQSQVTLRQIAVPISCGYSEREVAASLGVSVRMVKRRLDALREELKNQ